MCNDPNSPDPQRFCCMRGWSITLLVFGIFEVVSALFSVQGIIAGEPCYICPTKAVAYTAEAGYWCDVGGVPRGDSNDDSSEFSTQALCESNSGKWTVYSCGDAHQTFLQAGNPRRGSNAEVIRSGHATCTEFQGFYADKCCVDGSAPPNTTSQSLVQLFAGFVIGMLKVIAGGVLSCCAGKPNPGKMKCAQISGACALVLDLAYLIVLFAGIGSVTSQESADFYGVTASRFRLIFVLVGIGWQMFNIAILSIAVFQVHRAKKAGIGGGDKAAGPAI